MKRQIRRGVFETNSSSVHSLTMCMQSDFDKWVAGELVWNKWDKKLVPITDEIRNEVGDRYSSYLTYDQFCDWDYIEYKTFKKTFTTPNGEQVVGFGYYGEDR